MKSKKPDFLDLLKIWFKEHPTYNRLHVEKAEGPGITDGAVLLIHRKNPSECSDFGRYEGARVATSNYLLSISRGGSCWNHLAKTSLDVMLKPHNAEIFTQIERALEQVI